MSAALFDDPVRAWVNGRIVLWLGVTGPTTHSLKDGTAALDDGGYSLVHHTDGKAEWVPTETIQTDWRYDDTKDRWFTASLAATPDDGDTDDDPE